MRKSRIPFARRMTGSKSPLADERNPAVGIIISADDIVSETCEKRCSSHLVAVAIAVLP